MPAINEPRRQKKAYVRVVTSQEEASALVAIGGVLLEDDAPSKTKGGK
jgi:hypothetical protein